jgi:hypothetical protein
MEMEYIRVQTSNYPLNMVTLSCIAKLLAAYEMCIEPGSKTRAKLLAAHETCIKTRAKLLAAHESCIKTGA